MEYKEIIKYVVLIGALPVVIPFIKALVIDLLQAFELDGGLLGEPPMGDRLEKLKKERAQRPDPLVSEPLAHVKAAAREEARKER